MSPRNLRAITQKTGARVSATQRDGVVLTGTVTGHYDDDSVYILWDGWAEPERVPTSVLELLP